MLETQAGTRLVEMRTWLEWAWPRGGGYSEVRMLAGEVVTDQAWAGLRRSSDPEVEMRLAAVVTGRAGDRAGGHADAGTLVAEVRMRWAGAGSRGTDADADAHPVETGARTTARPRGSDDVGAEAPARRARAGGLRRLVAEAPARRGKTQLAPN
jgi:hypothetical protein